MNVCGAEGEQQLLGALKAGLVDPERGAVLQALVDWAVDVIYFPTRIFTAHRYIGTIKSYSPKDGYGFIQCDEVKEAFGNDVFLHGGQLGAANVGEDVNFAVLLNKMQKPQAFDVVLGNPQDHLQAKPNGGKGSGKASALPPLVSKSGTQRLSGHDTLTGNANGGCGTATGYAAMGGNAAGRYEADASYGAAAYAAKGAAKGAGYADHGRWSSVGASGGSAQKGCKGGWGGQAVASGGGAAAASGKGSWPPSGWGGSAAGAVAAVGQGRSWGSAPPPSMETEGVTNRRFEGTIKSFSEKNGFGFLICEELESVFGKDVEVFIHRDRMMAGFQAGDEVSFGVLLNKAGKPQAKDMQRVGEPAPKRPRGLVCA